jgi:hypothetical protein
MTSGSLCASGDDDAMNSGVTTAPRPGLASKVSLMTATRRLHLVLPAVDDRRDGDRVADLAIDAAERDLTDRDLAVRSWVPGLR